MIFRLPGGPGNTDQRSVSAVISSLRAIIGAFQQIDHGYPVFSRGVLFADLLDVLVRGEAPGRPVGDIEPEIDKILLCLVRWMFQPGSFHAVHILVVPGNHRSAFRWTAISFIAVLAAFSR